ncbi:hypothetical protein M758_4G260100 [Ceratodon purpureus]|nr:hypothetical protein M758_4G260100 [Ceratodon purpureus]
MHCLVSAHSYHGRASSSYLSSLNSQSPTADPSQLRLFMSKSVARRYRSASFRVHWPIPPPLLLEANPCSAM